MKRIENINYKNEVQLIYGTKVPKKIKSKKILKYDKERYFILGISKNRFKNLNKQFNFYKEDFKRNIEELENRIESNFNLSYNKTNINNIDFDNNKNKNTFQYLKTNDNIKKKLLPSLSYTARNKLISSPKSLANNNNGLKLNTNKMKLKKVHFK